MMDSLRLFFADETNVTASILAGALIVLAFSVWRERREYEPGNLPLIPYNILMFTAILVAILAIAHLITLITGKPFVGRMG